MFASSASWLADRLSYAVHHLRLILLLTLVVLIAYELVALLVRRFLPGVVARLLLPVLAALIDLAVVVLLGLEALAATPFRVFRLRPPGSMYLFGAAVLRLSTGSRRVLDAARRQVTRLRRLGSVGLLLLLLAGLLGWHYGVCSSDPESSTCRSPASASVEELRQLWGRVWHTPPM